MSTNIIIEITILLSEQTSLEEKTLAATNIINNNNLHLAVSDILVVFDNARISCDIYSSNLYDRNVFLFNFLLNKNIGMFIAITKMCNSYESSISDHAAMCYTSWNYPHNVGFSESYSLNFIISSYKRLLYYNDFDINNLTIPEKCQKSIQKYRDKKYGGKLTKVAKN